jgi:hypothetical protein
MSRVTTKPCCSLTNPITSRETDSEQHGSWSDCADAQAGLDPCWSQTHYVGFVMTRLKCNHITHYHNLLSVKYNQISPITTTYICSVKYNHISPLPLTGHEIQLYITYYHNLLSVKYNHKSPIWNIIIPNTTYCQLIIIIYHNHTSLLSVKYIPVLPLSDQLTDFSTITDSEIIYVKKNLTILQILSFKLINATTF